MSDKVKLVTNTGPHKDVVFLGYGSAEDFDKDAGKTGACVEEGNYNVAYRDTLPTWHDLASPVLESLLGVKRNVNEAATAKAQSRAKEGKTVAPVMETYVDFAARAKAAVSEDDWKAYDEEFRKIALANPVDATPSRRAGSGATKVNLEKADEILNRAPDAIEAAVAKMLGLVPDYDLARDEEGKPERTSLARMIGAYIGAQTGGL